MSPIELPFLYQTRTILRCFSSSGKALRNHKPPTSSAATEETSESFLSQKGKETADSARRKSKPSITRTEKQVFDGIFHDIKTSSGPPTTTKQFYQETDPNAIFRLFVQEFGQRQIPAPGTPVEQKIQESSGSGWNEHLKRYPPILRHAALQLTRHGAAIDNNQDQLPYISFQPSEPDVQHRPTDRKTRDPRHGVYRPLEAALETEADGDAVLKEGLQLRNFDSIKEDEIARGTFRGETADYVEKELKKISGELHSCIAPKAQSGAFRMWDICQQRILPIVLELNQQPEKHDHKEISEERVAAETVNAVQSKAKKITLKQVTKKDSSPNESFTSPKTKHLARTFPPGVFPLAVITILYPTLTLLALRLFTTHFPTTPFPLSLYTTLKTTSPQSRILGLNVHFYNTLLRHLWDIYSDLHGLTSTLREMQASGVDFDGDTYAIIRHVEDERWNDFHAKEGSRGLAWWGRPDQVRGWQEVMLWKGVIAGKLQEQGMGHLLAEREYSQDLLGEHGRDEKEGPRVWL
jgi:hypothetical protein